MKEEEALKPISHPIKKRLLQENIAMIKYLASEGKTIPPLTEKILDNNIENPVELNLSNAEILTLHNQLSQKLLPAKPMSILLLYNEARKEKWYTFLGPVWLVRRLVIVTVVCLIAFIGISLSPCVNTQSLAEGILKSSGWELLINLGFILSAAALGGCFSALFQVNTYLNNGTYDPKFETSYWIRLLLGIIAGLMMAVVLTEAIDFKPAGDSGLKLTIPLLAMLGGFSAALVYRILTRLVFAVESIFIGKQEDVLNQKLTNLQALHEKENLSAKQAFIQNLTKLKSALSSNKPIEDVQKSIDDILNNVFNES